MKNNFFNTKQKIIILIVVLTISGLWALLAFLIKDELISRFSLWSSLIIGTGSVIISTTALSISIQSFIKAEQLRIEKIEEKANAFINDNATETDYIPLCIIANSYDNHHKYFRKIYNTFNVLNKDVQKEVLKQLNYDYKLLNNNQWIDKNIEVVRDYISKNELGTDLLYDNAKYFYRSIDYSNLKYDTKCEYDQILPDYFNWTPDIFFRGNNCYEKKISFNNYIKSYLSAKKKKDALFIVHKNDKPIDMIIELYNLLNCEEELLCYWMMQVIISVALNILRDMNNTNDTETNYLSKGDAQIETFEDRFLEVLMELYNLDLLLSSKHFT